MHRAVAIIFLACAVQACGGLSAIIPVRGEVDGQEISATVDSEIAEYYLTNYLRGARSRADLDSLIDSVHERADGRLPSRDALRTLTQAYSTDFAALFLWREIRADPKNRAVMTLYSEESARAKLHAGSDSLHNRQFKQDYLIVFVPGWFYRSQPESGADFTRPRVVLSESGARTSLLEIDENGSVERNADQIVREVIRLSSVENKIILVSASKAGPEVALALSNIRRSGHSHGVKAWVNIGGLLRGSALADEVLKWPVSWYVKFFVIGGRSLEGIESLTTARSTERANQISLPPEILVLNYVGIPLSGQVSDRARPGYSRLRREGPNDGLTQVVDVIPPGSITIPEFGLDHYYNHPEIHIKTVALARTIIRYLEGSLGATPNRNTRNYAEFLE